MRRTRRSRRGPEATLEQLAARILGGDRVVFVCGAGISAASGIPTFRGAENSVWTEFVMEWGTRRKFLKGPAEWYRAFWEKKFPSGWLTRCAPNAGHEALSRIARAYANVRVVTQNVDGLQRLAVPAMAPEQLIEAHGRMGLHKCTNPSCRYAHADSITFPSPGPGRPGADAAAAADPIVPACPLCGNPCLPQVLLFDEDYESHAFYRFDEVQRSFGDADAFVFVGTSASVGITAQALAQARSRGVPLFTVNLVWDDALAKKRGLETSQALGTCEVLLPMLADLLPAHAVKQVLSGGGALASEGAVGTAAAIAPVASPQAATASNPDDNRASKRPRVDSAPAQPRSTLHVVHVHASNSS
jgi:NAD-dependent SIR2 family protein deacetylase